MTQPDPCGASCEPAEDATAEGAVTVGGFLRAWSAREHAPRTTCDVCHFESSEGYSPSHASGCGAV